MIRTITTASLADIVLPLLLLYQYRYYYFSGVAAWAYDLGRSDLTHIFFWGGWVGQKLGFNFSVQASERLLNLSECIYYHGFPYYPSRQPA